MLKENFFDVLIIGGGPIGLACGIEAKRHHLSHQIIEKGTLVNSLYNYPIHMTFFSTSEKLEMGNVPFMSLNPKPTRQEALEYYRRVKEKWKLNVNTYEDVNRVEREGDIFRVFSSKGSYSCKNLIIATGFYDLPNKLNIPGEDLPKVSHYFKEAHPYIDQDVIVIGARNSAVDAALEVWRKGGRVTMIIRKDEIHPKVKYWVRPDIENRIKAGEITAYYNSEVREIKEKEVIVEGPEGGFSLKNDFVLAMTGFTPDYAFLRHLDIAIEDGELAVPNIDPDTHETSQKGIFLAGTVCGGKQTNKWFIENSIEHAEKILKTIHKRSEAETINA